MEKLFNALKELEEKVPNSHLKYIVQNPHHITEEEIEEWDYNFHKFMTLLKFDYERTIEQAERLRFLVHEHYDNQVN